jgi:hypothetical protein
MTDANLRLFSALEKLQIPVEGYERHSDFQALPARDGDPIWNDLKNAPYHFDFLELAALKNARCGVSSPSPPSAAGKY